MRKIAVLVSLFVFSTMLYAKPADVSGYGEAKWGMTEQEVQKTDPNDIKRVNEPGSYVTGTGKLEQENIEIAGQIYIATYIFNDKNKLVSVNVASKEEKDEAKNLINFEILKTLLSEKYGAPESKNAGAMKSLVWDSDQGSVQLAILNIPSIISNLTVTYKANNWSQGSSSKL